MTEFSLNPGINLCQLALQIWPGPASAGTLMSAGPSAAQTSMPGAASAFVPSAATPQSQLHALTGGGAAMPHAPLMVDVPAMPDTHPHPSGQVDTAVSGGIAVFGAGEDEDDPSRIKAWVWANFSSASDIPRNLRRIRNDGVRATADIGEALNYLASLDPRFERAVRITRERIRAGRLSITIGRGGRQNSAAHLPFAGKIDRRSEEFGERIILGSCATPDILLHEIVHILPFSEAAALFGEIGLPQIPRLDPEGPFIALYKGIAANARAHEVMSFGAQCLMYDVERARGATHIFECGMMSDIYGAWRISSIAGIGTAFPYYMGHYERREGLNALLIANVIKARGSADLTWDEYERIVAESEGSTHTQRQASLARTSLERYVRRKGLIVPDDFFLFGFDFTSRSVAGLIGHRRASGDSVSHGLAQAIQSKFDAIDRLEAYGRDHAAADPAGMAALTPEMVPPADSHGNRKKLFAAYAAVVDRVLENPPGSFSREEIASLVGFVRMLPPHTASDVARRLMIYIDDGMKDLGVALGLILYEKGLRAEGEDLVTRFVDLDTLSESLPLIQRIMGPAVIRPMLEKCYDEYRAKRKEVAEPFRLWAMDQFILRDLDDPHLADAIAAVFDYPELFRGEPHGPEFGSHCWHSFATWLVEHTEVDNISEERDLLDMQHLSLSVPKKLIDDFFALSETHGRFVRILRSLGDVSSLDEETASSVNQIRNEMEALRRPAIEALVRIIRSSDGGADGMDWGDALQAHGPLSADEGAALLGEMSRFQRDAIGLSAEMESQTPWNSPKKVEGLMRRAIRAIDPEKPIAEAMTAVSIFKRLFIATRRKYLAADPRPSDSLVRSIPRLIDEFRKRIDSLEDVRDFADIGTEHVAAIARPFIFVTDSVDRKSMEPLEATDVNWMTAAMEFDPALAARYGVGALRDFFERGLHKWGVEGRIVDTSYMDEFIIDRLLPICAFSFVSAIDAGDFELARQIRQFVLEEIPQRVPPEGEYEVIAGTETDDKIESTWGKSSQTYPALGELRWSMDLALGRAMAVRDGSVDGWQRRVRDEINRGGKNIRMDMLVYFADRFKREGDFSHMRDVYQLMMQKSFASLGLGGLADASRAYSAVRTVIDQIHGSPFPEEERDAMLCAYLEKLLGYVDSFRGIDLSMVAKLEGLFSWRTPFMKAGDPPNYPRTESFILARLAAVDELVDPGRGKDDRLRLGAFAAVGLPLQRYHEWLAALMEAAEVRIGALEEQGAVSFTHNLERLSLPHPYDIPVALSPEKAGEYIDGQANKLRAIFERGDTASFDVALRVASRLIGSELRFRLKENNGVARLEDSVSARFVTEWIGANIGNEAIEDRCRRLVDVVLDAGPRETDRSGFVTSLLDKPISIEMKRELFAKATSRVLFSSGVRATLAEVSGDTEREIHCMRTLLSIRYERHPRGMPTDFFMDNMIADANLRAAYERYISGRDPEGGDEDIVHPMIMAELGAASASTTMAGALARWRDLSSVDRMNLYLNAVRFLRRYFELFGTDGFSETDEYRLDLKRHLIRERLEEFTPYLESFTIFAEDFKLYNEFAGGEILADVIDAVEVILLEANFHTFIAARLDEEIRHHYYIAEVDDFDDDSENEDSEDEDHVQTDVTVRRWLEGYAARIERYAVDFYRSYMDAQRASPDVPEFVRSRGGLEQDVLIWAFGALAPEQRNLLRQRLEGAHTDRERLLHFGRAAHLEKLMQLASIHPAVPRDLQELFAVFQEDVPHRDRIDAMGTLRWVLTDEKRGRLRLDLDRPIKEGTIGGVYNGEYDGEPLVFKLRPDGKNADLMDSLSIVAAIRSGLQASGYAGQGARALDDFLSFYERTIVEEMDLSREAGNAEIFAEFLRGDGELARRFIVPEYRQDLSDVILVAMRPTPSRRLKDLSAAERRVAFDRIDQLASAMAMAGVIHFGLHPGNVGLMDDGRIVLYDMGRICRMTDDEMGAMMGFQMSLMSGNMDASIANLRGMGTVWDEAAFGRIGELISGFMQADDPLRAIEDAYSRLPNYGFRLADPYVKLLLMHLTWNGTKKSLEVS